MSLPKCIFLSKCKKINKIKVISTTGDTSSCETYARVLDAVREVQKYSRDRYSTIAVALESLCLEIIVSDRLAGSHLSVLRNEALFTEKLWPYPNSDSRCVAAVNEFSELRPYYIPEVHIDIQETTRSTRK